MKFYKTPLALMLGAALLTGCNGSEGNAPVGPTDVKIATYNLSFDRDTFEQLADEMALTPEAQQVLVDAYLADKEAMDADDKTTAEKVIQIRNVAAIIQVNRPDVIMLAEYNNEGEGEDKAALTGFQTNYLSVAQSIDGPTGEANLEPIKYPFAETYATNTGLLSGFDLNNDGKVATMADEGSFDYANDSWGFGKYHGQYAFALMSKYEIDTANTRTFQNYKWKDLDGAENPFLDGEFWYTDEEWSNMTLSSKNHVDAPIIIPTENGDETIHLLMSHPTPPVFDTGKNKLQNAAEVEFWNNYVKNVGWIYDDAGNTGGLEQGTHFVIMGDQNLDPEAGDGITTVMQDLHNNILLNQEVMNGDLYPTSEGAAEYAADESKTHPIPNRMTSTFGLGVDYAMPSATLNVTETGVYWPASNEEGRILVKDDLIPDDNNDGKEVSSDHRMVWIKAQF